MNHRWQKIIEHFLKASDLLTSSQLAVSLQVSSKTIRNDIKDLNDLFEKEEYAKIESFRGKGYRLNILNDSLFKQFLQNQVENNGHIIPTEPKDRIRFLVERLLFKSNYLRMDDLADELFISRSTLQSDLNKVREVLEKYNLSLEHKPNYGIKVIGDEMKIRFCISQHVFNQDPTLIDHSGDWLEILEEDEINIIKESILSQLREHKIITSDISLHNLITHIAISCKRIREKNDVEIYHKELKRIRDKKEYAIAKEIVKEIESKLNVTFLSNEIAYLAIHLQGTKTMHAEKDIEEVKTIIDKETQQLTRSILYRIDEKYSLQFIEDEELILALTLHLKPAINRYKYNMNLRNPMLSEIKAKYPFSFEAALTGSQVIYDEINISFEEDEIGYMALHIEAALERQKKQKPELQRCLIVCASGVGTAQLLLYKLKDRFANQLNIIGTTEYHNLDEQSCHQIDFIISTIPIKKELPVPIIQISTLLGDQDINKIEKLINNDIKIIEKYLRELFTYLKMDFRNKEDVINFLGDELYKTGLVDKYFTQSVLNREKISPTSFGNLVAIPHPIEPQTDKTFWSIVTLKNPINWGDKSVQIVCLLNIAKENEEDLKPMYNTLAKLLENYDILQCLLESNTFIEFKTVLEQRSKL